MSDLGRIHALSIANLNGQVLYERFWDRLSEIQKAEMRTALGQCSRDVLRSPDGHVGVGHFRGATIVFQKLGSLVYYCVGSGEYDELSMLPIVQTVMTALRASVKSKKFTEVQIAADYDKVGIVVDEIIHEGIVDNLNIDEVAANAMLK